MTLHVTRRRFIVGSGAAALTALAKPALALTPAQRAVILGRPPFNPLSLFAGGYAGFYFPGGSPATPNAPGGLYPLYKNAGVTPAVADADPIGRASDFSPNANNANQTSASAKPTLKQTSSIWNQSYDGGDYLQFGSAFAYAAGAFCLIVAVNAAAQSNMRVFSEGNSGTDTQFYSLGTGLAGTSKQRLLIVNNAGGTDLDVQGTITAFDSTWKVITYIDTGSAYAFRVNGQDSGSGSYSRGATTLNVAALGCLLRTGATRFITGLIGPALGIGRVPPTSQIAATERFFGAQVGVAL